MRKIMLLLVAACLLALGAAGVTQAAPAEQQVAPQPQITSFTSSITTVDRTALVEGEYVLSDLSSGPVLFATC